VAEGGPPIAVVDWQTVSVGNPMGDIAYFIGAGLHREERRQYEQELVRAYHQALLKGGVGNYPWEDCWQHYRLYSFAGFHMAVMASILVERTERGDEMFRVMAERHGHQILDLGAEELLQ
jgi:aminoglycoside phosphotransferase (APT) family kinase protein